MHSNLNFSNYAQGYKPNKTNSNKNNSNLNKNEIENEYFYPEQIDYLNHYEFNQLNNRGIPVIIPHLSHEFANNIHYMLINVPDYQDNTNYLLYHQDPHYVQTYDVNCNPYGEQAIDSDSINQFMNYSRNINDNNSEAYPNNEVINHRDPFKVRINHVAAANYIKDQQKITTPVEEANSDNNSVMNNNEYMNKINKKLIETYNTITNNSNINDDNDNDDDDENKDIVKKKYLVDYNSLSNVADDCKKKGYTNNTSSYKTDKNQLYNSEYCINNSINYGDNIIKEITNNISKKSKCKDKSLSISTYNNPKDKTKNMFSVDSPKNIDNLINKNNMTQSTSSQLNTKNGNLIKLFMHLCF